MKTKIKTISTDQNIIEHESGLKTVFVEGGGCDECQYYGCRSFNRIYSIVPCMNFERVDGKDGNFTKLLER